MEWRNPSKNFVMRYSSYDGQRAETSKTHAPIINCCYGTRDGCVWGHSNYNQNLCIQKHPQNTITTTTTTNNNKTSNKISVNTSVPTNKHTQIPFSDLKQRVWHEKKKSLCKNQLLELPKKEKERKKSQVSFLFLFVCSKESHKRAN